MNAAAKVPGDAVADRLRAEVERLRDPMRERTWRERFEVLTAERDDYARTAKAEVEANRVLREETERLRAEVARREREHAALVETAQGALASVREELATCRRELEEARAAHVWKAADLEVLIQNEHKLYADAWGKYEAAEAKLAETERGWACDREQLSQTRDAAVKVTEKLDASEQREANVAACLKDIGELAYDGSVSGHNNYVAIYQAANAASAALSAPPAPAETARKRDEPCKCGKITLKDWWESVTDAGNDGTDYLRHTRTACLTKTERDAAPLAETGTKAERCVNCGAPCDDRLAYEHGVVCAKFPACTPSPSVATAPAAQDGGEKDAGSAAGDGTSPRMASTIEKYRAGKLITLDETIRRVRGDGQEQTLPASPAPASTTETEKSDE
jgi:hypothetical protein